MAREIFKRNDIINGEAWVWPPLLLKIMVRSHPNIHGFPPPCHLQSHFHWWGMNYVFLCKRYVLVTSSPSRISLYWTWSNNYSHGGNLVRLFKFRQFRTLLSDVSCHRLESFIEFHSSYVASSLMSISFGLNSKLSFKSPSEHHFIPPAICNFSLGFNI